MAALRPPDFGLGLEPNINRLAAYNSLWPVAFVEEEARIRAGLARAGLAARVIAIEHYGSTAVPGLGAKPIIDLEIGVGDITDGLAFMAPMATLGYAYMSDHGIPDHHVFVLGDPQTHLAHVLIHGCDQWRRTLWFRDRLRAEPDLRARYEALKRRLCATAPSRAAYTAGKTEFVRLASVGV
jgi:GrpB-like predicted nucleotidyltransferase (UPF0157 family)